MYREDIGLQVLFVYLQITCNTYGMYVLLHLVVHYFFEKGSPGEKIDFKLNVLCGFKAASRDLEFD